ncbi:phosphogluconate dehydrogenase C-terminal domain-containing protein [Kineococcus rhizosphaerae]|uniref:6-phosphogluconate dehydrogenase-like protein n=1 Tax=Kineococcus rhizosphaerae TaxID=559628 RepID=A0A2T0R228_9ACTN|nr:phosphogluconate dehydrogenase C-terminal domain-containing protein [Kineococcus rhizosphaerae]PRY13563.1 6-phosphogluconate dehydrogenase-like protein [Kineococcus rhizosphaerae]
MTTTEDPTETPTETPSVVVAVVGAGGKMGMRVSRNLQKSAHTVRYAETSPAGTERMAAEGRTAVSTAEAVDGADVVVLAVPDTVLGVVSQSVVPAMKPGSILLTLDPAAAYAGLLAQRADVAQAVAHPCHPSVFLERTRPEEYADNFGGEAARQNVVAAFEHDDQQKRAVAEDVIRTMYGPVDTVHWVSVKQLAVLEPTLVETVACMIGQLLKDALHETVHTVGVPEEAAKAMLFGHVQIALTNTLRGSNPFSEACLIAMDYGRESIVKDDWKKIFRDDELDSVITRMLKLEKIER